MMCHGCVRPVMSETVGGARHCRGEFEVSGETSGWPRAHDPVTACDLLRMVVQHEVTSRMGSRSRFSEEPRSRAARGGSEQERLADSVEGSGLEHACIDEPVHPAVAAERVRVVVEAADGSERPAAAGYPLLDLAVAIFNAGAEAVEIVAKALLDGVGRDAGASATPPSGAACRAPPASVARSG
jgi:hypothetical protein